MKKSRFNLLVERNEDFALLFNFYSRGFVKLSQENYEKFESLSFPPEDETLKELKAGFFIQDDEVDELEMFDARNRVARYSSSQFGLTIVPTLDCIFSCEYCFEAKNKEYMSRETEKEIIEFFRRVSAGIRHLHVSWFGGEPLMAKGTIDRLSKEFTRLCQKSQITYSSDLVTNGYLLTKRNIEWLKRINVDQIQITFDGDEETHDQRRKLKNGGPTFRVIMQNLKNAAGDFRINLRLNIDKKNIRKVQRFFPVLEQYQVQDKVSVYYGTIYSATDACKGYEADCLDIDALGALMLELHKDALDKDQKYISFPFPLAILGGCGAMKPNYYIVDPQGFLHKCLNTLGTDLENIGHVSNPIRMTPSLAWWLTWDPVKEKDCRECQALPLCGGGCPYNRKTGQHSCTYYNTSGYMARLLQIYYRDVYLKEKRRVKA